MLLMIDNYDSFTYNLVQYFGELGDRKCAWCATTWRSTSTGIEQLAADRTSCLSPGPGTPDDAGVSLDRCYANASLAAFRSWACASDISRFGQAFGGNVVRAARRSCMARPRQIRHARRSRCVRIGLPSIRSSATRYHSLVVEHDARCPSCLEVTAWTEDANGAIEAVMGMQSQDPCRSQGVQFHPESILTEHGHRLLKNFLAR